MNARYAQGWQLVLADLALILFLVTLAMLAGTATGEQKLPARDPHVAPSQALFRPSQTGPSLADWLAEHPTDARATLTIFAQFNGAQDTATWSEAQELAKNAALAGTRVRVVIMQAETNDLYASLAYDTAPNNR